MRSASALASLLLLAGVACASVEVEFDPATDVSGYRTWAWLPLPWTSQKSPRPHEWALDAQVRGAVERELSGHGYRLVEGEPPDFYVTYHLEFVRKVEIYTETPAAQTVESHHNSPSYTISVSEERVRTVEEGALAVDIASGDDRQLVWRGTERRRTLGSFQEEIDDVVARIFEHLPVSSHPTP